MTARVGRTEGTTVARVRVHLVANRTAGAGRAARRLADVRARLAAQAEVIDVEVGPGELPGHLRTLAESGELERVIAAGGDGLVHMVANGIAGTEAVLGIVPIGTGNDIARALHLPDDPIQALGDPTAIDLITTDHGHAVSVLTAGFSGDVNARANELSWPKGQQRYTVATLAVLPGLRPRRLRLDLDGAIVEREFSLLAVGNTAWFGGGMQICPGADPTDGRLTVVALDGVSPLKITRFLPTVFPGRHVRLDEVSTWTVDELHVTALDPVDAWADGELLGPLGGRVGTAPGALRVASARPHGGHAR